MVLSKTLWAYFRLRSWVAERLSASAWLASLKASIGVSFPSLPFLSVTYLLLSVLRKRAHTAPSFFTRLAHSQLRDVPGVVLTCCVVCLLPLFKFPVRSLKSC